MARPRYVLNGPGSSNNQPNVVTAQPNSVQDGAFNPRQGNKDFFWYTNRVLALSSAAPNGNGQIITDADSDFYCVALSYQADIAVAAITDSANIIPLVNVLITDSGSGKALMNNPVPIAALFGDGRRPYRLIRPRVFAAQAQINLAYTSYVAAGTTYNITLVFHGYKVYLGGNQ